MGSSTFGVTYLDVQGRMSGVVFSTEQRTLVTDWIEAAAAEVGAEIYELGIEPSDVPAEDPLHQLARSYIISHAVGITAQWMTRQDPILAQSMRDTKADLLAFIRKRSVGVRGENFDRAQNRGTYRKGKVKQGAGSGGGRGVGGWNRNTRM